MNKLRRHDWRNHREIECNICSEIIENRQQISEHRRTKHQMYRKIQCTFFPDCYDGDECFFEHTFAPYMVAEVSKCHELFRSVMFFQ